jgi:P-type Ca2+ transporter type 2C
VVQLLWINMIMDMLAALALASEPPQLSNITNPPVKKQDSIITKGMWRQILGMTAYITGVMLFMFFFIDDMWGLTYQDTDDWTDVNGDPTSKCKVFTMLFNTFIYLNLFNQINCRKVKSDQLNVFANIFSNFHFLSVFCAVAGIQYVFVQWGGKLTRCAELSGDQYAFSVLVGSTALIFSFILKRLPEKWNDKIPELIDEKVPIAKDDFILKWFNQANAKVLVKKDEHTKVSPS